MNHIEHEFDNDITTEDSHLQIDPNSNACQLKDDRQRKIPTRFVIALMAFLSSLFGYIIRSSLSLTLLAMVNVYDENGTQIEQPDYGPRYDWGAYEQSLILGAFFYSYSVTTMPIGLLLDRYGIGKQFVFVAFAVSAGTMLLIPWAASTGSFGWLFAMRLVIGAVQGGTLPNIHRLISQWAPPSELGAFMLTVLGCHVGTVVAWTVTGSIVSQWGWKCAFYVDTLLMVLFLALWWRNVYDRPALHPRIEASEREFIELSKPKTADVEEWPPIGQMLCSVPFWALLLLHFSSEWGWYFLLTGVPKFMNQVLGFKLSNSGLMAALPFVASMGGAMIFGLVGDYLRNGKYMTVIAIRKSFCVFSHILPSICLCAIPLVAATQPYACVALMTLAFAFNGALVQTALANNHDIGPNCAASLMAVINCMSAANGFLSPLVVAFFTSERNTALEWRYVFWTGGSVYFVSAIVFMVFGSATDQRWVEKRAAKSNKNAGNWLKIASIPS